MLYSFDLVLFRYATKSRRHEYSQSTENKMIHFSETWRLCVLVAKKILGASSIIILATRFS